MRVLTTPEAAFADLPGWADPPRRVDVGGLSMAVVDQGPRHGRPVVLLHGEPTWGYVWRAVTAWLADAGHRVIVPDLVGFGRSDKPAHISDHRVGAHVAWLAALLDALDLPPSTLVGHDWGGILGLRLLADQPQRFAAAVLTNTFLPDGSRAMPPEWQRFREVVRTASPLEVGRLVRAGTATGLDAVSQAAYDAPFPDEAHKAGVRALPELVADTPEHPEAAPARAAWQRLAGVDVPVRCVFGADDPITRGADQLLTAALPGAQGWEHLRLEGAGHFIQEDAPRELAAAIDGFAAALRR